MIISRVSRLLVLLLAISLPAWSSDDLPAPEVTPQPHPSNQELTLVAHVSSGGKLDCDLHFPVQNELSRTGNTFRLDYQVRARSASSPMWPCVLVPMPVRLSASLGTLPAGDYQVVISGTTLGQRNPDQHLDFTIFESAPTGTTPVPEVTPSNPTTADVVRLSIVDGAPTNHCNLIQPSEPVVYRQGSSISVDYAYRRIDESEMPPGSLCLATQIPARFSVDLGQLPAGRYEVSVTGTLDGVARSPQAATFSVLASGVEFVPLDAGWALALMLLALGGVAAWRLRAR